MSVSVRGNATAEELAAVLAVVSHGESGATVEPDGYSRWRATRLAAMHLSTIRRDESRCATIGR